MNVSISLRLITDYVIDKELNVIEIGTLYFFFFLIRDARRCFEERKKDGKKKDGKKEDESIIFNFYALKISSNFKDYYYIGLSK